MNDMRVAARLLVYLNGSELRREHIGGKAAGVNALLRAGYPVPRTAVLTASAYREFVADSRLDLLIRDLRSSTLPPPDRIAAESAAIERSFLSTTMPAGVVEAIGRLDDELAHHGPVAVRSSATAEDQADASFAGQYTTFLNVVGKDDIAHAVRRCWASLWLPAARAYRRHHQISERGLAMAVVIQPMVEPNWSGVAFTTDPQTEGHLIRVEAVPGLGEGLVSGRVTPADYLIRRDTLEVIPTAGAPPLGFLEDVARVALRIETDLRCPQDIEWAHTDDGLILLQVRPITRSIDPVGLDDGLDSRPTPGHKMTPHGVVEMVPGVVTPLLWTINAPMLENAFRTAFADLGGELPPKTEPIVGRFRGRAALDLSAICEVAGSLPGGDPAEVERQYLGQAADAGEEPTVSSRAHVTAAFRTRRAHNRIIDEVELAANAAAGLTRLRVPLTGMPVRRLVAYRQRIRDLAWRAYAAEVGASSAAGATYRALELLLERWLPGEQATSWAQVLTKGALTDSPVGGGRTRGLEAVLDRLGSPEVRSVITRERGDIRKELSASEEGRQFLAELDAAVREMGSKAMYGDETWAEDEDWIWHRLRFLTTEQRLRRPDISWAEDFATLSRHLGAQKGWRRIRLLTGQIIDLRLRWLQRQVEETTRFLELRERAKNALLVLGGEERRVIREAVRRLHSSRQIHDETDIRFVTDAELEGMLFGACGVSREMLERRKQHHLACLAAGPLPDSFVDDPDREPRPLVEDGTTLNGWAASPGVYEGAARVVTSLADGSSLQSGEVLIAHSTDPSWTPLFLVAGAVVLEVGGPLSHAAIVAREFGLPAVLNVRGAAHVIADGELVRVDGTAGVVGLTAREDT